MASAFKAELGLHFTLHMATQYTIPDLARLASLGQRHGFGRIWINENFGYRHTLLALTSIAMNSATNGVDLGVAITHPYVRNPLDAAAAFASLTEVMARQNLIVGLAIGDHFILGNSVHMLRPSQLVVEMARLLKELWKGETVRFADFPNISSLYRLKQDRSFKMSFKPRNAISLYCAGSVKLVSEALPYCDGIIIGGEFITLVEGGMLETHLDGSSSRESVARKLSPLRRCAKSMCPCRGIERPRGSSQANTSATEFLANPTRCCKD